MPHTTAHQPDPPHHTPGPDRDCDTWHRALEVLREAGAQAGRDAADWWEQDTLGGRASGHTTARAVAILAGLEDIDPAIVDALPACDRSGQRADQPAHVPCWVDLYHDAAPADAPRWDDLDPHARDEAIGAYCDGYDNAAHDGVAAHCRRAVDHT